MTSRAVEKFTCPHCGYPTISRVLATRDERRRRLCLDCYGTYSTTERVDLEQRKPPRHRPKPTDRPLPLFEVVRI